MGNSKSSPAPPAVTPVVPPEPPSPVSPSVATPPPPVAVPSPSYTQEQPKPQTQLKPEETSQNPGTFEEFHKKCKGKWHGRSNMMQYFHQVFSGWEHFHFDLL